MFKPIPLSLSPPSQSSSQCLTTTRIEKNGAAPGMDTLALQANCR